MKSPCKTCGVEAKVLGRHRCVECLLRTRPMTEQIAAADARLAAVPAEHRRARIPESQWPAHRRWCAGCQSFRLLLDFARGATRCRPCATRSRHNTALKSTFGITRGDYDRLLMAQGGVCAICRRRPVNTQLAVDHDHRTGEVRGLLCARCNHELLGAAFDDVEILRRAVDYMENPPARVILRPAQN